MQLTFTGNPQKDAAILQKAREQHISQPVELDTQIQTTIRHANLDFSEFWAERGNTKVEVGRITVGTINTRIKL